MSMDFTEWESVYERILRDFGFDRDEDRRARDVLAALLEDKATYDPAQLDWRGQTVAIAGGAATLAEESQIAQSADVVVAASIAADRLEADGIAVDCLVTDLDKNPETVKELTANGIPVAVHAHGDNIPTLEAVVPTVDSEFVIPTTQTAPLHPVKNFGGFTDGDRAAFLAACSGASRLVFPGWDFDDPTVSAEKAQKLRWAERLLYWLECRRGDRFAVLDGRRDSIDTTALPVE